jgi:tRNA(adenine34) deaminase
MRARARSRVGRADAATPDTPYTARMADETFMRMALDEARRENDRDATAHAEMLAIRDASGRLGRWRLTGCTVYVTLEPCPMCAGAMHQARIDRVVYAAPDAKAGAVGSLFDLSNDDRLNHRFDVTARVLEEESAELLRSFFGRLRVEGGGFGPTA